MPVFISWSGERSKTIAEALHWLLPHVIDGVTAFVSTRGIEAGKHWHSDLMDQLNKSTFGVFCVGSENREAPWLNFEAGAIANGPKSRLVAVELDPGAALNLPLSFYQSVQLNKNGIVALFASINVSEPHPPVDSHVLASRIDQYWNEFEQKMRLSHQVTNHPVLTLDQQMLQEILLLVRGMNNSTPAGAVRRTPDVQQRFDYRVLWQLIRDRARQAGIPIDITAQEGRADFIVGRLLAIETKHFKDVPQETTYEALIDKVVGTVTALDLVGGMLVLGNAREQIASRHLESAAEEVSVGVVYYAGGKLVGTRRAFDLAPWLVDEVVPEEQ